MRDGPPTKVTMRRVPGSLWGHLRPRMPVIDGDLIQMIRERPGFTPDDLLVVPGIYVKACDRPEGYLHGGILVGIAGSVSVPGMKRQPEVVVMSTTETDVYWVGSLEEYEEMWTPD